MHRSQSSPHHGRHLQVHELLLETGKLARNALRQLELISIESGPAQTGHHSSRENFGLIISEMFMDGICHTLRFGDIFKHHLTRSESVIAETFLQELEVSHLPKEGTAGLI